MRCLIPSSVTCVHRLVSSTNKCGHERPIASIVGRGDQHDVPKTVLQRAPPASAGARCLFLSLCPCLQLAALILFSTLMLSVVCISRMLVFSLFSLCVPRWFV